MAAKRIIRILLAILASGSSLALSWPYWRDFEYWAESRGMWLFYFALGFVLAVYVFYIFFGSLDTLFEHDVLERQAQAAPAGDSPVEREDAS